MPDDEEEEEEEEEEGGGGGEDFSVYGDDEDDDGQRRPACRPWGVAATLVVFTLGGLAVLWWKFISDLRADHR